MNKHLLTIEVDETWWQILGQISRHQEGFVWIHTEEVEESK
jgi:hypothetical protein